MDFQELINMLEYSALVYQKESPYIPNNEFTFIDNGDMGVQYLIQKNEDKLQIIFRGTDSLQDAMVDIKFWKKVIPYGNSESKIKVHTGFLEAYKSIGVRDAIWQYIDDGIKSVEITGHSYGAALAVLCAVDLQYNFKNKDYTVILFGCPRVGNRAFAKSYNKRIFKTFRVENSNDAVTKIPFKFMGYKHVGISLHIGYPRLFFLFSANNHNLQNYYEQLWKRL